ncbi:hypothetical protein D3C87_1475900 [compost metagenome]
MVAQHEVHRAAGGLGLLLQAVQQPECLGHLRATVEYVAGHHQGGIAQRPLVLRIDHVMGAQQPDQQAVLAVDVRHGDDARRGRVLRHLGRARRQHVQRVRVAALGQHHAGIVARRQRAAHHVVVADPLGLAALGGEEHIGTIGIHMLGRLRHLAGADGGAQQQGGREQRARQAQ